MERAVILSLALAAVLCSAGPSRAEGDLYSREFRVCMDKSGGTATDMLDCIHQEHVRQDRLLNANYKKAMDAIGKVHGKTGRRGLKDAEVAWLQWRDLDLPLFQYAGGGTFSQLRAAEDLLEKTARRARFLGDLAGMVQ